MERDLDEHGAVILKHGETSQSLSLLDIFTQKVGSIKPIPKLYRRQNARGRDHSANGDSAGFFASPQAKQPSPPPTPTRRPGSPISSLQPMTKTTPSCAIWTTAPSCWTCAT